MKSDGGPWKFEHSWFKKREGERVGVQVWGKMSQDVTG